jgi:hypothetical protein
MVLITIVTALSIMGLLRLITMLTYGDGFGDINGVVNTNCAQPAGYVANNTDCWTLNPVVNSNATEICADGIDNNCNGNG